MKGIQDITEPCEAHKRIDCPAFICTDVVGVVDRSGSKNSYAWAVRQAAAELDCDESEIF